MQESGKVHKLNACGKQRPREACHGERGILGYLDHCLGAPLLSPQQPCRNSFAKSAFSPISQVQKLKLLVPLPAPLNPLSLSRGLSSEFGHHRSAWINLLEVEDFGTPVKGSHRTKDTSYCPQAPLSILLCLQCRVSQKIGIGLGWCCSVD